MRYAVVIEKVVNNYSAYVPDLRLSRRFVEMDGFRVFAASDSRISVASS
jgi:hypothetical protein